MAFVKAVKSQVKLRLGLVGPSGAGKTYSALAIASGIGKRVAVIDSENGSASLYADEFSFDVQVLKSFDPLSYVKAIHEAEAAGYDVIVIDSLSHAWAGKDGALQLVDDAVVRDKNKFTAWRTVTPKHNALVDAMLQSKAHVIATMRAKVDYILEDGPGGKKIPKKIGMAPIQREGLDYEFSVAGDLDLDHNFSVTKTRCKVLDNKVIRYPGKDLAKTLLDWLNDGVVPAVDAAPAEITPATHVPAEPGATPAAAPSANAEEEAKRLIDGAETAAALEEVAKSKLKALCDAAGPVGDKRIRAYYAMRSNTLRTAKQGAA